MRHKNTTALGINAALSSAFFLGFTPVFGRQAILLGVSSFSVVAIRTTLAALLLLTVMLLFYRRYLYIYPAGLLGCLLAGVTNGIGSLFFYYSLSRINANLGQMLYSLYPLFLAFWLSLDHQKQNRLTFLRMGLAIPAVFLLLNSNRSGLDLVGAGAMLIASMLYALHLPINQRVLYDMPPQTVTLYTLMAMSVVVLLPFLFLRDGLTSLIQLVSTADAESLLRLGKPLLGLTLATFLARLLLFTGVKHLGGMQTALLGLGELLVTLIFSSIMLQERFTPGQWAGAALLIFNLSLVVFEQPATETNASGGLLKWLNPQGVRVETDPTQK